MKSSGDRLGSRWLTLALFLGAVFVLQGCLFALVPKKKTGVTMEEVKAAEQKGDLTILLDVASGKTKTDKNLTKTREEAGNAVVRIAKQKNDLELLARACRGRPTLRMVRSQREEACSLMRQGKHSKASAELAGDCTNLKAVYEKHHSSADDAFFYKTGIRAAECKMWDYIWTDLAWYGKPSRSSYGGTAKKRGLVLMGRLEKAGHDPVKALLAYLEQNKSNPFGYDHGESAVENVVKYMVEANKAGNCERFIPFAKNSKEKPQSEWIWFFGETKCKAAAPLAALQLMSERASVRMWACKALGKIGAKRQLPKVKTLASTDPAFRIVRLNKIWYVRDACRAAAGRIAMSN
jgi:hypothetical protein